MAHVLGRLVVRGTRARQTTSVSKQKPAASVYSAVVRGVLLRRNRDGQCTILVKALQAAGAGIPVIAAGDSLQAWLDESSGRTSFAIDEFLGKRTELTLTLQYYNLVRLGDSRGAWRVTRIFEK